MNDAQVQRFVDSIIVVDDGCWLWTKHLDRDGYGQFYLGHRMENDRRIKLRTPAPRAAYEHWNGLLPSGYVPDHLCRHPVCVNPDHLEGVTNRINILRGVGAPAINARRTHCKHGHELSGDNLRMEGSKRACKECKRRRTREWMRAQGKEYARVAAQRFRDAHRDRL